MYGSTGDGGMNPMLMTKELEKGFSWGQSKDEESAAAESRYANEERVGVLCRAPKIIGYVGSFAIFVNSIIGPGLLSLPKVFDDAGALLPAGLLVGGFGLASAATLARSETVALMPDNAEFTRVVEFCDPALRFVGRKTFYASHLFFYLASMATAMASIVLVSESVDIFLAKVFGRTYALTLDGGKHPVDFVVWRVENCKQGKMCKPFQQGHQVSTNAYISLGYVLAFCVIFPVSTTRLSEGMHLQYASLLVTLTAVPAMIIKSAHRAAVSTSHLPLYVEDHHSTLAASGVVLFNLMYGIFVSTWLGEKKPEVDVKTVVYTSSFASCALMIGYGCAVAAASADVANDGLLEATQQGESVYIVAVALCFGFFVIASGIPVACIMARHNLVSSALRLVDETTASAMCVWFPWATAWIFSPSPPYRGLVSYSGLFVVSWIALWLPFFVLLHALDPNSDGANYFAWWLRNLVSPPDDHAPSVLRPLPFAWLQRRARTVYALLLFLVSAWIAGALASYLISFIAYLTSQGSLQTNR